MANPKLPDISEQEQNNLYEKLNLYNQKKASYKEVGCYVVVPPTNKDSNYTLWIYTPLIERRCFLYIEELFPSVITSLRKVTNELWYANRGIFITEYNEKRMSTHGDDLIAFGKYRGHFLHEIAGIDPGYITWIAHKYRPQIPKQERFVKMAQTYNQVYLDKTLRKQKQRFISEGRCFIGHKGDKVGPLTLKVLRVRIEDNPYKTRFSGNTPIFYVRQRIAAVDNNGNHISFTLSAHTPSRVSCQLPSLEHGYHIGEIVQITSARVAATYIKRNIYITNINYVKIRS